MEYWFVLLPIKRKDKQRIRAIIKSTNVTLQTE